MPKRKRAAGSSVQDKLDKCRNEVARALKLVKAFERQRMNKRLHDRDVTPEKRQRLEREIAVLKSLDLHQTARAHLYSSLVKVKSIAAATDLPDEVRTGVPKPELPDDEKFALHNVTSGLYNREQVKTAIENAVTVVCDALGVPVPEKAGRTKKSKRADDEEQPDDRIAKQLAEDAKSQSDYHHHTEDEEESDFQGFESDVDESGPVVGEPDSEAETAEESALSKYDHLLGSSSDEDDDGLEDEDALERFKGREKANLDDISLSGSEPNSDSGSDADTDSSPESASPSPPPKKQKAKKQTAPPTPPATDSTFLPSLMGGYISGSESASDVDVAPPKKRRGQKARQAIWEQKYGAKAKHLANGGNGKAKSGRDAGWDTRRGAVDGEDRGRGTPWKKGVTDPLSGRGGDAQVGGRRPETKREKDDQGALHPSWAAKKKAKESQKPVAFSGHKVVFD